jgi:hypothetical protein
VLLLQSTQRVLATFTAWDLDGNGTLSKAEFSAISQVGDWRSCPAPCPAGPAGAACAGCRLHCCLEAQYALSYKHQQWTSAAGSAVHEVM